LDVAGYLEERRKEIDLSLDQLLPLSNAVPAVLHQAMRYSVFAGGKRLRPILALSTGQALGGDHETIKILACALEMIHTYSLIHDDLPAMDDDDLRRGRPSCHKRYGEGIAILAGNGLMNLAFKLISEIPLESREASRILQVLSHLTRALGSEKGVIAGQAVDLKTQGGFFTESDLLFIHTHKTGALIEASIICAAILSDTADSVLPKLSHFGMNIGLAFQIVDDILDVVGDSRVLGKETGKDAAEQKATYPALFGLEASRKKAEELVQAAVAEIDFLGSRGEILRELAHFISIRRY
jgi:geranylgeranyl diphosphate synthase type II